MSFSLLICLGTIKFVLLSMFTLKETICSKICSKLRLKSAKGPLPVDLRRSKTSLLKVLLKTYIKWNLFTSYEGNSQHHFVCLFLAQRSHRNCARVSHSMGQFFPWNQPHYWKRSEVIQLRSPTPIITNVTAIGTRTPSQEAFILGDPGADSGDEGKSKRAEKYGTKKSKERREEPLGTMSYQTSSKRSPFFTFLRSIYIFPPV